MLRSGPTLAGSLPGTQSLPPISFSSRRCRKGHQLNGKHDSRQFQVQAVLGIDDIPKQATPLTPQRLNKAHDQEPAGSSYEPPPLEKWQDDPVLMSGCELQSRPLNVAVLLSGGVDSSLALKLLVAAGHNCKAFYLQIWFQEDFRNFWDSCPWEEDLKYAQEVCDALGVTLEVVPMTNAYWERVVSSSVVEIRAGRTPNPDMLCNSRVKFGAFLDYLEQLETDSNGSVRFDRVASGHYARVVRLPVHEHSHPSASIPPALTHHVQHSDSASGSTGAGPSTAAYLSLTPDAVKDQTYFLAHLSPRQLSRVMFPLGTLTKPQVRALATAAGLATQARKDSQGICFLGKVKFPEFVKEHLGEWPGLIVEEPPADNTPSTAAAGPAHAQQQHTSDSGSQTGTSSSSGGGGHEGSVKGSRRRSGSGSGSGSKGGAAPCLAVFGGHRVLGMHSGYWFYTVGQRGGIKLPGGPWYVTRKDCDLNIVYVSRQYYEPGRKREAFITSRFSWLSDKRPDTSRDAPYPLLCKVRHGPHAYQCQMRPLPAADARSARGVADDEGGVEGCWDAGALVVLDGSDQGLAGGQYAVLYQGGVCLGTAKIESCVDVDTGYDGAGAQNRAGVLTATGLQFEQDTV